MSTDQNNNMLIDEVEGIKNPILLSNLDQEFNKNPNVITLEILLGFLEDSNINIDSFLKVIFYSTRLLYSFNTTSKFILEDFFSKTYNYIQDKISTNKIFSYNKFQLEQLFRLISPLIFNLLAHFDYSSINNLLTIDTLEITNFICQESNNSIEFSLLYKYITLPFKIIQIFLDSSSLERRNLAINFLNEQIYYINYNEKIKIPTENINETMILSYNKLKEQAFLLKSFLIKLLHDIQIFNIIFGEKIHESIILKSSFCLNFLYNNNQLSLEQISLIWKFAQEKHEAISSSILSLFSQIVAFLSLEHAMYLLKEISQISLKDMNNSTLRILESFSFNHNLFLFKNDEKQIKEERDNKERKGSANEIFEVNPQIKQNIHEDEEVVFNETKINNFKSFYIKLLSKLIQEENYNKGFSNSLLFKFRKLFANVLTNQAFRKEFHKYLKKLFSTPSIHELVNTNIFIIENIFENLKRFSKENLKYLFSESEDFDISTILTKLDKSIHIIPSLLHCIIFIKNEVVGLTDEIITATKSYIEVDKTNENINNILNCFDEKDKINNNFEEVKSSNNLNDLMDLEQDLNKRPLDDTLSTEKSIKNSISTISTQVSTNEKDKQIIVKEFLDVHGNNIPNLFNNFDFVFKNLKLNFKGDNYFTILERILNFIKYLVFSASNISIKQSYLEFLYIVMIDNSADIQEQKLFLTFFTDLLHHQFLTGKAILSEEVINYLFFDVIHKFELKDLLYEGFKLFSLIFFYVNTKFKNITLKNNTSQINFIDDIYDFSKLFAFESLWFIYLKNENNQIKNDSLNIITNIIAVLSKKENNEEMYRTIIDKIFTEIEACYDLIAEANKYDKIEEIMGNKENKLNDYIDCTKRLIQILSIINNKRTFIKFESEIINVQFMNCFSSSEGKKHYLHLSNDSTIKDIKTKIAAQVLNNPNLENNIILQHKSKILINNKQTLLDIKYEPSSVIIIFEGSFSNNQEPPSDAIIEDMISQIKIVFELNNNVIAKALGRNNYNIDESIIWLTEDINVLQIEKEIDDEANMNINQHCAEDNTEKLILFTETRFILIKRLLDLDIQALNNDIWKLISSIKVPSAIITRLTDSKQLDLNSIFDTSNINDLLINLKIINTLIFGDCSFHNIKALEEAKRIEWKNNFLFQDGSFYLLKTINILLEKLANTISKNNRNDINSIFPYDKENHNNSMETLLICVKFIHFFTLSSALSIANYKESLNNIIKTLLQIRPSDSSIGISNSNTQSKDSTPSNRTPVFGSPHNSFDVEKKNKSFVSFSANPIFDQYDIFEEELSNNFLMRIIQQNIHKIIVSFFQLMHIDELFQTSESEKIFYLFFEIHSILNDIDIESFRQLLIKEVEGNLLLEFLYKKNTSKYVRKMIENMLIILSQIKILDKQSNDKLLVNQNILDSSFLISNNIKSTKEALLLHVSSNYKLLKSNKDIKLSEEYYNIYGYLLKNTNDIKPELYIELDLDNLCYSLLHCIFELIKNDNNLTEFEQDQLAGMFFIIQSFFINYEQAFSKNLKSFEKERKINLIELIYDNLFHIKSNRSTENTLNTIFRFNAFNIRKRAYDLLIILSKVKEELKSYLVDKLALHHCSIIKKPLGELDLDYNLRTSQNDYIGLRNYGATCYFNALMQQLYMIDEIKSKINQIKLNNENMKYNPTYQIQSLFYYLKYSINQVHSPMHLIQSFNSVFNNQPIDVRVQQDCEEFFNILVEKIEESSGNKSLFDDIFKIKISSEIISLDDTCPYYSETITPYNSISLDIKNKKTLQEAFESYVKGEILEGENKFYIDKFDKKVPILRRTTLKSLPLITIVHLKRFDFDYMNFEKTKLNDYLSFPSTFDFSMFLRDSILEKSKDEPYMKNIEIEINSLEDDYTYELIGILIHSGSSADAGHYFSFIKNNNEWLEFDDSRVSKISEDKMWKESFGEDKENDYNQGYSKCTNAYMLFYKKVKKINDVVIDNEEIKPSNDIFKVIEDNNVLFLKYKTYISNDYYLFLKEILEINILGKNKSIDKLNKDKSLSKANRIEEQATIKSIKQFDKEKLDYMNPIHFDRCSKIYLDYRSKLFEEEKAASKSSKSIKSKLIILSICYYIEIITEINDKAKSNQYILFLRDLLETDKEKCAWFLKRMIENQNTLVELLLNSFNIDIRDGFYKLITLCIHNCSKDEEKVMDKRFSVLEEYELNEENNKTKIMILSKYPYSIVVRFFKFICIGLFDCTRNYWTKYNQFMHLVLDCINYKIPEIINECVRENFITKLIYFIMNNTVGFETKYQKMGGVTEPNFIFPVNVLAELICSFVTKGVYEMKLYSVYNKFQGGINIINLPENYYELLINKTFLYYVLRRQSNESTKKIIHHLSWGVEDISIILCNFMVECIKESFKDTSSLINLLNNYHGLVEIDDKYKHNRFNILFGLNEDDSMLSFIITMKDELAYPVLLVLRIWGDLTNSYTHLNTYFNNNTFNLSWIYYFLNEINSNQDKRDNLQIEATADNINLEELLASIRDNYLIGMRLKDQSFKECK